MCLSTVYNKEQTDDNILMENVMMVEISGEKVILTDLFGRSLEIIGTLIKASLTDGYVIVNSAE